MKRYVLASMVATLLTLCAVWALYNLLVPGNPVAVEDYNLYRTLAFSLLFWNSLQYLVNIFQWAAKHENKSTQL